jgi:hypothetical protein
MRASRRLVVSLIWLVSLVPAYLPAKDVCELEPFIHQQQDAATIQRLEASWNVAIAQGDSSFERCLLSADFFEILSTGEVKTRADELGFTEKNKQRKRDIPPLPPITVVIHGNVAVARGTWKTTGATLESQQIADCFVWENGSWHVFFSQLTPLEDSRRRVLRGWLLL